MDSMEDVIVRHPLAHGLSKEQRAVLVECATPVFFEDGQLIFTEGGNAQNFYLIQSGAVGLELNSETEAVQIDLIEEGGVLGWAWMFPPYYWHFDARAVEPTHLISFYGKRLREECERDHALGYHLANYMGELVIKRLQKTRIHLLQRPTTPKTFSALAPN